MQRETLFVSGDAVYSPDMTAARVGLHKTFNLDQHVAIISKMVQKSLRDGESRRLAVRIASGSFDYSVDPRTGKEVAVVRAYGKDFLAPLGKTCKPHDARCEMEKIWDFVVLNVRYVYDTAGMDVFATVKETLISGGADCDDLTILFATLLKHLGFEVIARVVSTKDNPGQWVHIYPLCGLPKDNPTQWVPLDTTVDGSTPGWEYRDIAHTKDYVL
jgi:hypothetical protein